MCFFSLSSDCNCNADESFLIVLYVEIKPRKHLRSVEPHICLIDAIALFCAGALNFHMLVVLTDNSGSYWISHKKALDWLCPKAVFASSVPAACSSIGQNSSSMPHIHTLNSQCHYSEICNLSCDLVAHVKCKNLSLKIFSPSWMTLSASAAEWMLVYKKSSHSTFSAGLAFWCFRQWH